MPVPQQSPEPPEPEPERLRATVAHLASFERASASSGERRAAEWIRGELTAHGWDAELEAAGAHGTYWLPLGLLSAAGVLAGVTGGRGGRGRRLAAATGLLAAAGIAEDVSAGPQLLRRVLPRRTTTNVVAERGEVGASACVVFVAHHDAAQSGLIFHAGPSRWIARRLPGWYAKQETSPQFMRLVTAGPALAAAGALTRSALLRRAGTAIALGSALAFADVGLRPVVPGANDNASAVAVILELARVLDATGGPPPGLRVILLSTGSEESFMEGMRAWVRRHGAELRRAAAQVVVLESVGSPQLVLLEGEGMLEMRDYAPGLRDLLAASAARAGQSVRRGLRSGFATDGLLGMRAGLDTAVLASCDAEKNVSNYHSPLDTADRVDYATVTSAALVCLELLRALSPDRTGAPAPG